MCVPLLPAPAGPRCCTELRPPPLSPKRWDRGRCRWCGTNSRLGDQSGGGFPEQVAPPFIAAASPALRCRDSSPPPRRGPCPRQRSGRTFPAIPGINIAPATPPRPPAPSCGELPAWQAPRNSCRHGRHRQVWLPPWAGPGGLHGAVGQRETRRRAGMIQPIFIRQPYSCTARARGGARPRFPGTPRAHTSRGREMRKSGSPCTWDTNDTSTTCGKGSCLLLPGLSPPASPGKGTNSPLPAPGHRQPSAAAPRGSPESASRSPREDHLPAEYATGQLGFLGNLLSVYLHHAMPAPRRSCCEVVGAGRPWKDPRSTQAHGHAVRLSPDPNSEELS